MRRAQLRKSRLIFHQQSERMKQIFQSGVVETVDCNLP